MGNRPWMRCHKSALAHLSAELRRSERLSADEPVMVLGRPVPRTATVLPDEAEDGVNVFLHTCARYLLSGGGVLRLAGDGLSERMLHWVLAVGLSRLRALGVKAAVCGQVFNDAEPPLRPADLEVAVLLEAPVYGPAPAGWGTGPALNVLVGHAADWGSVGIRPDWVLRVEDEAAVRRRLAVEFARLGRVAPISDERRRALLLNANSMDAPAPGEPLEGFVPVGDGGWMSIESGQWLARDVLGGAEAVDVPEILAARYWKVRALRGGGAPGY